MVSTGISSQEKLSIECFASPRGDSIIVKWVAGDYNSWQHGMEVGYTLSRITFRENGRILTEKERADSEVFLGLFKPLEEDAWMEDIDTSNRWEVLAAGTIYGELAGQTRNKSLDLQYFLDAEIDKDNRYAFNALAISHSNVAAIRMGLGFVDKEVVENNGYLYEVSFAGDHPNQERASELVVDNKAKGLPTILSVSAKSDDLACNLSWPTENILSHYLSYDVWRSDDGGKIYTIVNNSPVIYLKSERDNPNVSYSDILPKNDYEYFYKIKGKTLFERYSSFSIEQGCEGKGALEVSAPVIIKIDETTEQAIEIEWDFSKENEGDILGFRIMKSKNYDGPYEEIGIGILNKERRRIIDESPLTSGYYFMEVIDIYNKTYSSAKHLVQLKDVLAPDVPTEISCELDTSMTTIHIAWQSSNEVDLAGFRLLTGNNSEEGFIDLVEGVISTNHYSYPVSKKQNGETLYFRIASVDKRGNTSNLSASCKVVLIDNTPPIKPLIRKINNNDSTIIIEWAVSPSKDVNNYSLESRLARNGEWESSMLNHGSEINNSVFICNSENTIVEFRIRAEDKGGNVVYSDVKKGKTLSKNRKEKIADFKGNKTNKGVELSWIYFAPQEIDRFILYRAINSDKVKTYKIISQKNIIDFFKAVEEGKGIYSYKDISVQSKSVYTYKIRAIWKDGTSSSMSEELKIKN